MFDGGEDVSVEKVVVESLEPKGSLLPLLGGAVEDDEGDGGASAPPGPPPMEGKSPPCVGGAVGSIRCAANISSGDGGAVIFVNITPIPSMSANKTPPTTAADAMALGPARAANTPPVAAPLIMEFHGSSFCRTDVNVQSQQAKSPPHTANCPPKTGARACTAESDPASRAPGGAILAPLMECQTAPPIFPIQNAPPGRFGKRKRCKPKSTMNTAEATSRRNNHDRRDKFQRDIPTSSTIRHGHGSLSANPLCLGIIYVCQM